MHSVVRSPAILRTRSVPDPVRVRHRPRVLEQQLIALLRVDGDVREERRDLLPAPPRPREEQLREPRPGIDRQRGRGEVRQEWRQGVRERVGGGQVVAL